MNYTRKNILLFKKVLTLDQAEMMRQIRNECRKFMTRNQNKISKSQQKIWFNKSLDHYETYLVGSVEESVVCVEVGYGLIKFDNNCFYLTGALIPSYRGKGHGNDIFTFLIKRCKEINGKNKILLEVLKDNEAAIKLYNKIGFIEIDGNEKISVMELKGE